MIKIFWEYLLKQILYRHRKKIVLTSTAIGLILWFGTSWGYFRLPFARMNAFEAISENTAFILETNQYRKTMEELSKKSYYSDLMSVSLLQKWERGLRFIDSLFLSTEHYTLLMEKAHIVSGVQIISNNEVDWLYAFDDYGQTFDVKTFLEELKPQETSFFTFRERTIYVLKFEQNQQLALAVFNGLILMSPNTILVESGIEQLDNIESNALRNESFALAHNKVVIGEGELFVYVNFKSIPSLTSVISKSNPRAILDLMSIGEWMGLDTRFLEKGFMLSGHLYPAEDNIFLKKLALQDAPTNSEIALYIPKNLGAMLYMGWGNFEQFYQSYQTKKYPDFEKYFLPWIGRDVALVFKDPTDDENGFEKDKLVFVESKDTNKTAKLLMQYAHQFGELEQKTYQNFELKQIAAESPFLALFGEDINPLKNPYYTMIGNYVVFANSLATLEGWVKSYNTRQMIMELPEYNAFFAQAKKQSNIYALLATPNSTKFLQYFVRPDLEKYIQASFKKIRNIYPIGIQFFGLEEHFLVTMSANYNLVKDKEVNRASSAWEADLAAEASIAPQVVRSHDGNNYIFAQDINHRLYFFDKNGENLWPKTKVISKRVISTIFEIDFHSNGQIQYVFNTDSDIYILDKNGQEIKVIPLISKASTGLLAVDYGKGPRFFIPCKNGNVYGYEQNGKPLSGWQPLERVGMIDFPMEMMDFDENNYLFMVNKGGNCQAFKRIGVPYFRGGKLGGAISGWGVDASIGRIAAGSNDGKIHIINTAGKGFGFNAVAGMTNKIQFIYADIIGDERKDYIRISNNKIAVHYYKKEKNSKGKVSDELKEGGVYNLGAVADRQAFAVDVVGKSKQYIGLFEKENGSVFLLDASGKIQNGFPLAGTSTFEITDLFGENGNTLVVANRDKIYAYKLKL